MPERRPSLTPQNEFDYSLIDGSDCLPGLFPGRRQSRARQPEADILELQTRGITDARLRNPQDGEELMQGTAKALPALPVAGSDSPPPAPIRYKDDAFDPARMVR